MLRTLCIIALISGSGYKVPEASKKGKEYLVFGSNTTQKIYFATSSNISRSLDARKAIDSDRKSSWISRKSRGPHWIEIDFGIKRIISRIVVYVGKKDNKRTVKSFILQFKYNDKWFNFKKVQLEGRKAIKLFTGFTFSYGSYKERAEIDLGGIDVSTFRIYIPGGATYSGYAAISEIDTYIGQSRLKYFDERLSGLCLPIKNGFLPENDYSYPNAPRKYRGGKHVGLDIFHYHREGSYKPIKVSSKTPVLAADDGVIIRADWSYKPMTLKEWKKSSAFFKTHPRTFVKRSFGGIQIWIDHGNGIVTTYNHLSKIAKGIEKGERIRKGGIIGWVGNSGLMGEAEGKNYGKHLHFEIWIDGHYLGYGMKIKDIRKYISWIFSIHH